jgi:hypothetical protein
MGVVYDSFNYLYHVDIMQLKIKHIGWFFQFLWQCIKDLRTPLYCVNEIGLFKENWNDFKTRIYFDTDPEVLSITKRFNEIIKNKEV